MTGSNVVNQTTLINIKRNVTDDNRKIAIQISGPLLPKNTHFAMHTRQRKPIGKGGSLPFPRVGLHFFTARRCDHRDAPDT